jgi:hypothetical protein
VFVSGHNSLTLFLIWGPYIGFFADRPFLIYTVYPGHATIAFGPKTVLKAKLPSRVQYAPTKFPKPYNRFARSKVLRSVQLLIEKRLNATFSFCLSDQYWNGAFVNQPSQEASIIHARCHWHISLPLPLRASSSHVRTTIHDPTLLITPPLYRITCPRNLLLCMYKHWAKLLKKSIRNNYLKNITKPLIQIDFNSIIGKLK